MSAEAQLEGLFDALMEEGTTQERGLSFTLESEKARKKLQEFAVAHPEHFQLLALAGLYALGARSFEVIADADDFALHTELLLEREMFEKLWSRAGGSGNRHGARLLALSFLTSARLDEVEWRILSSDEHGPWSYRLPIKGGEVAQAQLGPGEPGQSGTRLSVKRRSLGLVAKRYLERLRDRLVQREGADERLLRERLFLTKDSRLSVNGKFFEPSHASLPVRALAVMESGPVPTLVECDLPFRADRGATIGVILVHPSQVDVAALPGERNSLLWIWNGLTMDRTSLGEEFSYFRAFVWADELQPDLSLSQLISNDAKQKLERAAKTLARDLLHSYVSKLGQELSGQGDLLDDQPFRERLKVVKKALRDRISLKRARNRLASLNRALIACPILLGSDSLGKVRWWTFEEIWMELEEKRSVAASPAGESWVVPACPERPVVLCTEPEDWEMLSALLPSWALKRTEDVLARIESLEQGASELREADGDYRGAFKLAQWEFRWRFSSGQEFSTLHCPGTAGLVTLRPWAETLQGFAVTCRDRLQATYDAKLVDRELAESLQRRLLEELCREMAEGPLKPDDLKYLDACSGVVQSLTGSTAVGAVREIAWLPVYSLGYGLEKISLLSLEGRLQTLDCPCYELTRVPDQLDPLPSPWTEVPFVLCQPRGRSALSSALGRRMIPGRWLSKARRCSPDLGGGIWSGTLATWERPEAVQSLNLWVAADGELAKGESRRVEYREGVAVLDQTRPWVYPGLKLEIHWSRGWPGCEGTPWVLGGEACESDLSTACLLLGRSFLEQAEMESFLQAPPELLAGWTFDLLSDPVHRDLRVLLRADGRKISLRELSSEIVYFRQADQLWQASPEALYLPGELLATVELLTEGSTFQSAFEPSPLPVATPSARKDELAKPKSRRQGSTDGAKPSPAEPARTSGPDSEAPELSAVDKQAPALQPGKESGGERKARPEFADGLAQLDQDIWELAPLEIAEGFSEWVRGCTVELAYDGLLRQTQKRWVLGRRGWELCQRRETRAYLHSALFSAYNRASAEITDQQERNFHQALVAWLVDGKGSLRPRDKDSPSERTTLE